MSIVLERLTKRYGGIVVVDNVSLDIARSELFVLLGVSGGGKSTILRLIAGLARPDSGKIILDGRDVTGIPPQERGTGFVFQNYSVFRHMNVSQNIEFGLKIRNIPPEKRAQKSEELLELVNMGGLGGRYPDQLSGGQLQRVALGRALAYEPRVLLLDEPFGALDVKTRGQLRRSLKEVQRKLGVTAILVTHDQEEAFELADRIGILDHGRILEVGTPEALYAQPKTLMAATFLGAGTVLVGRTENEVARFGPLALPVAGSVSHETGSPVQVLFRPEQVTLHVEEPLDKSTLLGAGQIVEHTFSGALRKVRLKLPRISATRQIAPAIPFGEDAVFVDAVLPADFPVPENLLWVSLRGWHILEQPSPQLLVFEDGSGSIQTLSIVRCLAERMNASVTLLGVADDRNKIDARRAALAEMQERMGMPKAELRVRVGNPADQILAEQNEAPYSWVVLASGLKRSFHPPNESPSRRRLKRLSRIGPDVIAVIRQSALPVLVIRRDRPQCSRFLICTAVGEPGKSDVRVGGRLARRVGAGVTLLHITKDAGAPSRFATAHLERAAATLHALDVPVEISLQRSRSPGRGILAASREGNYDVIVVGSHGPDRRSLFGHEDVMLEVLAGADCAVLIVPPEI